MQNNNSQKKVWPIHQPVIFNIPVTIAAVLLLIFGSVGVILTMAYSRYEKQELTGYVRRQFIALADGLAPMVAKAYQLQEYFLVRQTLQTFSQNREIAFALVVDAGGMIVAADSSTWLDRPLQEFLQQHQLILYDIPQPNRFTTRFTIFEPQHLFLFDRQFHAVDSTAATTTSETNTLYGRLLMGYDSRFVEALVHERLRNILLLGGFVLLLGAAALYLVVHLSLIRPLRAMGQVMQAVAGGHLDARGPEFAGLPEVIHLMRQFNEMLRIRRIAAETLSHSEARFRSVVDATQDAMIAIDRQQCLTLFNQAAERLFGYTAAEIAGQPVSRLLPLNVTDKFAALIRESVEEKNVGQVYELQARHQNGTQFPIELTISSTPRAADKSGEENVYIVVIRDVTSKKRAHEEMQRLQEQLFQAQKMETIGTLAGGIAHDFNNLLVGILGTASLMKMTLDTDSLLQEHIQTIEQAAVRASDLTKQLLGFARAGKYEVRPINLNQVIHDVTMLITRTFDKRIVTATQLADELWAVEGDSNQLQHTLLNLCLNARDAMPFGGTLTLTTRNLVIDTQNSTAHFNIPSGKYVHLLARDTGVGMDAETIARVFEPFFSTKERSKGTGLGLAMVYGIVRNHGGRIYVESAIGTGATFHLYLPATATAAPLLKPPPPGAAPFGHETVLLVDDERVILDVTSRILQRLGYSVLMAHEGGEALRVFRERHREIALVILDMIMPKMSGREVFRRLKEIDPEVLVLLSSGYSADGEAQAILQDGAAGFVQKPYRVNDLAQAVKRVLNF